KERKFLRFVRFFFIVVVAIVIMTLNIEKVESVDMNDSVNINLEHRHVDSLDYCMRINDIKLFLSEIQFLNEENLKGYILELSDPKVLYRSNWENYDGEMYLDISNLNKEESLEGVPVTLSLPSITAGVKSELTFFIYIINDIIPEQPE
ncbi:hypothetical protein EPK30_15200, partial [Enterococcus faecalis]|nr:hypothetical protein [Enterococcus faecalis]